MHSVSLTGLVLIAVYGAAGLVFAVAVEWQQHHRAGFLVRTRRVVAWPFLVPLLADPPRPPPRPRHPRVVALEARLSGALAQIRPYERRTIDAFLARLGDGVVRLEEIKTAQTGAIGPAKPKLQALEKALEAELDRRVALLEELLGELIVLRFTALNGRPDGGDEEGRVGRLLEEVEALAETWVSIEG